MIIGVLVCYLLVIMCSLVVRSCRLPVCLFLLCLPCILLCLGLILFAGLHYRVPLCLLLLVFCFPKLKVEFSNISPLEINLCLFSSYLECIYIF